MGGMFSFFYASVDDDDDGAAIEMAKRKKKKMITLSDDEDDGAAVQIPGTLSGGEEVKSAKAGEAEDEEEDALELFMTNIKQEVSEDALQKENGELVVEIFSRCASSLVLFSWSHFFSVIRLYLPLCRLRL